MKIIVDTHILIWFTDDNPKLNIKHRDLISNGENTIYYSSISLVELSIKIQKQKLIMGDKYIEEFDNLLFTCLPFNKNHAREFANLPDYHSDPFDKIIISQAISEKIPVISYDSNFKHYKNLTLL